MIITKDKGEFKPYTINIQIHTQEDEDVIVSLGKSNISLPNLLEGSRKIKNSATYRFCCLVNDLYGNR